MCAETLSDDDRYINLLEIVNTKQEKVASGKRLKWVVFPASILAFTIFSHIG